MFSYLPKSYRLQTATMFGTNPNKHKKVADAPACATET